MEPMASDVDRTRLLTEVSSRLDAVTGQFDVLATEPGLHEVAPEIGEVRRSLANLRGAMRAQVDAGGIDTDLLRTRL